jgi:hypothetical protein
MKIVRPQVSGRGPTFRITRGSFFVTVTGEVSEAVDSGDDEAAAVPSAGRSWSASVRSGDIVGLVDDAPWLAGFRARNVIELGGTKALRLDDGSALRGSSTASRAAVRSNHAGDLASAVPSEDSGLLTSFSSWPFASQSQQLFQVNLPISGDSHHLDAL